MITGRVTGDREAVVAVHLHASDGRSESLEAVIDTGFTEFLAFPPETIAYLGLPLVGLQRMTLADGSVAVVAVFEAVVDWHGERVAVQVVQIDGGALLGMALLHGSRLTMDILDDGPVRLEPIA